MYCYTDQLTSERLVSKFIKPGDEKRWLPFFQSSDATKLFPDFGLNSLEKRTHYWIAKQLERYAANRYGLQLLYLKDSDILIGQCGLLLQEVDGIEELEVGYHILPEYWGLGYAPEAARMFMNFAQEHQLSKSIISIIDVRNDNSMRVARKNGLTLDKNTVWNNLNVNIFRKKLTQKSLD